MIGHLVEKALDTDNYFGAEWCLPLFDLSLGPDPTAAAIHRHSYLEDGRVHGVIRIAVVIRHAFTSPSGRLDPLTDSIPRSGGRGP